MARVTSAPDWSGKADGVTVPNAADAGLAVLTGSQVYQTDANAPWSGSKKYLAGVENTAGTIRVSNWTTQIDAQGKWACVILTLRLRTVTAANKVHQATPATNFFRINSGSVLQYYFTRTTLRDGSTNVSPGQMSGLKQGLSQTGAQLIDQTPVQTTEAGQNSTGEGAIPALPHDRWTRVALKLYRHLTDGRLTAYMGGQIIAETTKLDIGTAVERGSGSDSFTSMSALTGGWTFNLSAIAGMAWDIGPVEDWADNGYSTGLPAELRPNWSNGYGCEAADTLRRYDGCTWLDRPDGGDLSTSLSGATIAVSQYGTAGDHPGRNRMKITGTSNGQSATIQQIDPIGAPQYGPQGYMTVCAPMVYTPTNSTMTFSVRNAADTADIATVVFGATDITVNGETLVSGYTKSKRWRVNLMFGQNGDLRAWAQRFDAISTYALRNYSLNCAAGWTPQNLGVSRAAFAFGGAATAEFEGVMVCSTFEVGGPDSYSHTTINDGLGTNDADHVNGELSPVMGMAQHYLQFLGAWKGAEWKCNRVARLCDHPSNPQPRRAIFPVGASGHTLQQFMDEVIAGCDAVRGVRWWLPGNWTNDINLGGTSESEMATVRASVQSNIRSLFRFVTTRGMQIVGCTLLPWNYETTLDGATNKVDRTGTTCTLTVPAGHGFSTGDKITFVGMSDSSINCQSKTFTKTSSTQGTFTQGSGTVSGASGRCRYFNDQQVMMCDLLNGDLTRIVSEEQRRSLISLLPIGSCLPRSDQAFGDGFTKGVHPLDTAKFTVVDNAMSAYKLATPTSSGEVGAGWTRGGGSRRRRLGL